MNRSLTPTPVSSEIDRPVIGGIVLRYLLSLCLFERGPATIGELVDLVGAAGFQVRGRASKTVSDALRWEQRRGRAVRLGRGRYGPGRVPRQTRDRMQRRVAAHRNGEWWQGDRAVVAQR